jgi:hypothetical protein
VVKRRSFQTTNLASQVRILPGILTELSAAHAATRLRTRLAAEKNVETPHIVEILHSVETSPSHRMFYFRGMQSFHVNRLPNAVGRAVGGRTAPASITLHAAFTAPR